MRRAALIATLVCAPLLVSGAQAEGSRESRYGPAPERAPTPANARAAGYTGQAYTGRALGWSGKREMAAQAAHTAPEAPQPWWARSAPQAPQAPQAPRARTAYQPPAPAYAPSARELPQSIYDAPRSAAQDAPSYPSQYAPVPAAYAAPVQPAYRPQQQATLQPGQIGARTYSVGRQFGMTPDAIPAAGPPRMVLIAPPATAPEDDDKDKPQGDGDWSAKPQKDDQ